MRALVHVNALLGTGHAVRACLLVRALLHAGVDAVLVSGAPLPPIPLCQNLPHLILLPFARARDLHFSELCDAQGHPVTAAWRAQRRAALWSAWKSLQPDLVITEHFPLGRAALRFEILPLLKEIRARRPSTLIVASVRDLLVRKTDPRKEAEMVQIVKTFYDGVLVHSDPAWCRLEDSFSLAKEIETFLFYTGFLHQCPDTDSLFSRSQEARKEIVVSAGGSAFGAQLFRTALAAFPLCAAASSCRARLCVGSYLSEEIFIEMKQRAKKSSFPIRIERNRPDFLKLLAGARLSISQAGYNTTLDVVRTQVPALFIPSAVNKNEQRERARLFGKFEHIQVLDDSSLSPENLARAIDKILLETVDFFTLKRPFFSLQWDTGTRSAAHLLALLAEKRCNCVGF